ncbi:MAG: transposase [Thermodesulfobacteriota bacterium]
MSDATKCLLKRRDSDALDWLAAMTSHVPNKGKQMVRYYGHYSNASRGHRQKKNLDDLIPSILEPVDLKPNRTWPD